jgi:hypothetical protein
MRLLIIGTHPSQTTGYSKVVYNLCKQFGILEKNLHVTVFGIQKFTEVNDNIRNDLSDNIHVWDVYANDKDDFGFGSKSIQSFVTINNPDVVIIYNDAEVIKKYIMNLKIAQEQSKGIKLNFKIVVYLDQVHRNSNSDTIKYIAENSRHVFCFTEFWKQNYLSFFNDKEKTFYSSKCSVVRHGIDKPDSFYTDSSMISRFKKELDLPNDSFIFLNLNRYAMKKRLDITIQSFVKFLKNTNAENAYLFFPAVIDKTIEHLKQIYIYELKQNNMSKYYNRLIIRGTQISDEDVQKIYACCDVGINTCDGEGFGLCNYEHASYGRPQILSKVGGLQDYFNDSNSLLCIPKYVSYSMELERGDIVDPNDVAEKMQKYYTTRSLYNKHANIIKEIPTKYVWETEVNHMVDILFSL